MAWIAARCGPGLRVACCIQLALLECRAEAVPEGRALARHDHDGSYDPTGRCRHHLGRWMTAYEEVGVK